MEAKSAENLDYDLFPRSGSAINIRGRTYPPNLDAWASRTSRFPNLVASRNVLFVDTCLLLYAPVSWPIRS